MTGWQANFLGGTRDWGLLNLQRFHIQFSSQFSSIKYEPFKGRRTHPSLIFDTVNTLIHAQFS